MTVKESPKCYYCHKGNIRNGTGEGTGGGVCILTYHKKCVVKQGRRDRAHEAFYEECGM